MPYTPTSEARVRVRDLSGAHADSSSADFAITAPLLNVVPDSVNFVVVALGMLALATSSNIGSAATIIGNPQNMYIGSVARLPFGHFALVMTPLVLVCLALCWAGVALLFRRQLHATLDVARGGADAALPTSGPLPPPWRYDDHYGFNSLSCIE